MQRTFRLIAFIAVIGAVIFAFDGNTAAPPAIAMVTVAATAVVVFGAAKDRVVYAKPAFTDPFASNETGGLSVVISALQHRGNSFAARRALRGGACMALIHPCTVAGPRIA